MEEKIDFKKVESERDGLIKTLTETLQEGQMQELLIKSLKFREGEILAGVFYSYLRGFAERHKVRISDYGNLNRYIDYIRSYESLDKIELLDNLSSIENEFAKVLCKNDDQRTLFVMAKNIGLLEKFLMLKLSPEDLKYYKEKRGSFIMADWRSFLEKRSEKFRVKPRVPHDLSPIDRNLRALEAFYDAAFERDRAFLRNSLKKMDKERANISALIAGGFHTENLTRLFMDNGISYVVISPVLTEPTDWERFEKLRLQSYQTRTWD